MYYVRTLDEPFMNLMYKKRKQSVYFFGYCHQ